jgi:hypothetical protein
MAPTILVDGRETSTYEHASFNEILNFYKTTGISRQVFVYHYGLDNVSAVSPGQTKQLLLP